MVKLKLDMGQSVLTSLVLRPTKVATKYTSMVAIGNAPNVMATKIVTVPNYKENHSNHFNEHLEVNINGIFVKSSIRKYFLQIRKKIH